MSYYRLDLHTYNFVKGPGKNLTKSGLQVDGRMAGKAFMRGLLAGGWIFCLEDARLPWAILGCDRWLVGFMYPGSC